MHPTKTLESKFEQTRNYLQALMQYSHGRGRGGGHKICLGWSWRVSANTLYWNCTDFIKHIKDSPPDCLSSQFCHTSQACNIRLQQSVTVCITHKQPYLMSTSPVVLKPPDYEHCTERIRASVPSVNPDIITNFKFLLEVPPLHVTAQYSVHKQGGF